MILATLDPKAGTLRRYHARVGAKLVKDAELTDKPGADEEFWGAMVHGFRVDPAPYMPKGWRAYDPPVAGKGAA